MKRLLLTTALLTAWTAPPARAQGGDQPELKVVPCNGNVYMLVGRGGNIGISAGKDGILMVDDQFAPMADKIRAAMKSIEPDAELKFVLNTHWHGDHTGGNPEFGPEAPIIAHTKVRQRLANPQQQFGRRIEPMPEEGLPVVTFDESLSIHFNGEEIKVIHYPHGHTDGDSVIYFTKSNVVHMGDHFFNGMFPFVDLDHGGDVLGMTRNIADILKKVPPDAKVIPGHGELATRSELETYHRMLTETTASVRDRMKAGKTLDEIKQEGLPSQWQDWSWRFIPEERWIETIHRSLSRKGP